MSGVKAAALEGEVLDAEPDEHGFVGRPPCPFCSKPWGNDMLSLWAEAEMETGYYGDSWVDHIDATVDITCDGCERLIYRKDISRVAGY